MGNAAKMNYRLFGYVFKHLSNCSCIPSRLSTFIFVIFKTILHQPPPHNTHTHQKIALLDTFNNATKQNEKEEIP